MKKHFLLASLISVLAVPASAEGFYVFADLGQSKMKVDYSEDDFEVHINEKDNAFAIGGGYNFNQYFALEAAYRDFGSISEKEVDSEYPNEAYTTDAEFTGFQVSALGKLPVNDVVDLYGRLGFARVKAKSTYGYEYNSPYFQYSESETESRTKTKAVFGLGASFKVSESFAVRAEYNHFAKFGELKLSSLTAGVTYSF